LACSTNDRKVGVRVPLAAGSRVATEGQLLFGPWAWVYSTLHPLGVRKTVNEYTHGLTDTGYGLEVLRQVCATLLGARHVPERL